MNKPGWGCFLIFFWAMIVIAAAGTLLEYGSQTVEVLGTQIPGDWLAIPAGLGVGLLVMIFGPWIFDLGGGKQEARR